MDGFGGLLVGETVCTGSSGEDTIRGNDRADEEGNVAFLKETENCIEQIGKIPKNFNDVSHEDSSGFYFKTTFFFHGSTPTLS